MKKYVVAVCNLSDSQNTIKVVESDNEVSAVLLAVGDNPEEYEFESVEEVIQYYYDGDFAVSVPLEVINL